MTKQMMIDLIYEVIADKTLQFGCMYIDIFGDKYTHQGSLPYGSAEKIIGHPVMIGDVLDWFYSNIELPVMERRRTCDTILLERKEKRKPIEEQPDILIEYIHSLLIS